MKNVVFIPNIDLGDGRNSSYHYSVSSWKKFCEKNDCELVVWEELICPIEQMKITWQRYYMFDILELNEIDYDQNKLQIKALLNDYSKSLERAKKILKKLVVLKNE